jgi:hypothetical protein
MDTKAKLVPRLDANGYYILPEAELEEREVFPGHTIILSKEDLQSQKALQEHYERIVSTTAFSVDTLAQGESVDVVSVDVPSEGTWISGLFKSK